MLTAKDAKRNVQEVKDAYHQKLRDEAAQFCEKTANAEITRASKAGLNSLLLYVGNNINITEVVKYLTARGYEGDTNVMEHRAIKVYW